MDKTRSLACPCQALDALPLGILNSMPEVRSHLSDAQAFAATALFVLRSCMQGGAVKAAAEPTQATIAAALRMAVSSLEVVA